MPIFTVRGAGAATHRVTVDGRRVAVDDTPFDVSKVQPGTYTVDDGTRTLTAYVAGPPDARWVFLDGQAYEVDVGVEGSGRRRRRTHDEGLAAPMSATVIDVLVSPGQAVKAGDVLLTLEAMKMELAIRAQRDGVVKTINCGKGDLATPGSPLVELE